MNAGRPQSRAPWSGKDPPHHRSLFRRGIDQTGGWVAFPGTSVAIKFEFNENEVQLNGKLAARILRTVHQLSEEGEGIVWIGVHFEESEEKIRSKLTPVLQVHFPDRFQM